MAAQSLGARPGVATDTTCKIMVCSLSNASCTVTCAGGSVTTVSWDDASADATNPGYVDTVTVSGLSPFTQYTYTVTQGSNSIVGSFYTLPEEGKDYAFYAITCDRRGNTVGYAGAYDHIKNYAQNGELPVVGLLHIDDHHGYVDQTVVIGKGTSPTQPQDIDTEVGYATSYLNGHGLYGTDGGGTNWTEVEERLWCLKNLNVWAQWGDHEFGNDIGWDTAPPGANNQFTNGKAVWDRFMGESQPTVLSANSNAWSLNLGDVLIIAPDGVTNGNATGPDKTVYGATQISELKTAWDNTVPFKVLGMTHGIRYLDTTEDGSSGTQQPLENDANTEYQSIFTNDSDSLMANENTNGKMGTTVILHGDYHRAMVTRHAVTPVEASTVSEHFYEISLNTVCNSNGRPLNGTLITGATFTPTGDSGDSEIKFVQESGTFTAPSPNTAYCCRVEVYGTRSPKEVHFYLIDEDGTTQWSGKNVHRMNLNELVPVSSDTFDGKASMFSGED